MSTTENKVKLQLRQTLPGSVPGVINRPDKNPSPSKLMLNHGKPNYTINRSTSNPKNKPITTEITTSPSLTFPLKPTTPSSLSVSPTTLTASSSTNEIEKVVLKHVQSTNLNLQSSGTVLTTKPPIASSPVSSFVSPGISSKAAATSFGVKLKQCNNKKNLQNGDATTVINGRDQNINEEPEFVRRQKQIFEKLQQREQQQSEITIINSSKTEITTVVAHESISNENISKQNGYCSSNNIQQTNGHHTDEKTTINSHVKNVTNRLENVSHNNVINNPNEQKLQQNGGFKLPPGAICGKPAIPGKPANLQIPPGRLLVQQQNNLAKNQNSSINIINCNNENNETASSNSIINVDTTTVTTTNLNVVNENNLVDDSTGANFEQKTVVSFSKDLSTEPNRYPDTVKITKTVNNSNDNVTGDVITDYEEYDDDLKEFIATEKLAEVKLSEEMAQIKFDIKTTDEEDVTITPVVIR